MTKNIHATTVLAVRKAGEVAMAGDGQVTIGDTVMKRGAVKIRTMNNGKVMAGFAGGVADALTLFDRFEMQLERNSGNLRKSAVDLAKDWRSDRFLRRLEAQLLLADATEMLLVSGDGEVIEPDDDAVAIGSGGAFALSAARALQRHTNMSATEIVKSAMEIAAEICIYTNNHITVAAVSGEGGANA